MDDYRDAIASCCRQLRLSANLADNAVYDTLNLPKKSVKIP